MAIGTGNDPLSGAPDAGVRGRAASGRAAPSFSPSAPAILHTPDPFADHNQDFMAVAVGAGPSAVSFPLQVPGQGAAVAALTPFRVRWHQHGERVDDGAWEVYLPWGCASTGGTACIPTNGRAKGPDGDEIGWYTFDISAADSVLTSSAGSRIYRSWPVYALMKPWPRVTVSTARRDYEDEPWLATKVIAYAQEAEWTEDGKTYKSRQVVQYVNDAWSEPVPSRTGQFAIRYDPSGSASDPGTKWKAMLTNMEVTCGRFWVSRKTDVDITDKEEVVLKIDHSTDGKYALEIVDKLEETTDAATFVRLYRLDKGVVMADLRHNITTMPFFDV